MSNSAGNFLTDRNLAELLSYWATFFGIILALLGGAWAWVKHRRDVKDQEWSRARSSFASFIDTAIAHPEYTPGCWSGPVQKDRQSLYRYLWFMAKFLWAAEEILKNPASEKVEWEQAISQIIAEHADFFRSSIGRHESSCYHSVLRNMIDHVLKELDQEGVPLVIYKPTTETEPASSGAEGDQA
jgi:hypothetical protein